MRRTIKGDWVFTRRERHIAGLAYRNSADDVANVADEVLSDLREAIDGDPGELVNALGDAALFAVDLLVELQTQLGLFAVAIEGNSKIRAKSGPKPRAKPRPRNVNALQALLPRDMWPINKGGRPKIPLPYSDAEIREADRSALLKMVDAYCKKVGANRAGISKEKTLRDLQRRRSELRKPPIVSQRITDK